MKKLLQSLPVLLSFILTQNLVAQEFEQVQHLIGLENVKNNNGAAICDYDNDGDLDLYVVTKTLETDDPNTKNKLLRNNNDGSFTDVTAESGLIGIFSEGEIYQYADRDFEGLSGFKFGAFWGDYDNDGYSDIFFTNLTVVHLYHNNGDGTFTQVTEQAGITYDNGCGNTCATWFDYDNDSYLDLYISDWRECTTNTLYHNNGDGTFTNKTDIIAPTTSHEWASYTPFPFDFNNDGYMDLYLSNDLHRDNELFINQNGAEFTEEAESYGLANNADDMGISISDFNNDGFFDFFITAIDENFLFTDQIGTYRDTADDNEVKASGWSWGTTFADLDLDGDEDLYIANGYWSNFRGPEPNVYFKNLYIEGNNRFSQPESELTTHGISVTTVDFDYDNDGDLDVLVTNSEGTSNFFENKTLNNSPNDPYLQWLKISLEGTVSNRNAYGTTLTLNTTEGRFIRYFSGVSFLGQSPKPVHFGIPATADIESLTINWQSGIEETYTNLSPNLYIKATENNGYEVLVSAPADKPTGCTDPTSCNYNPDAIIDDGSCEYLQIDSSIVGNTSTSYFKIESYTYDSGSGNEVTWAVDGGEIIEHIDNEIKVKWGFEEQGKITAQVNNNFCVSEEIILNINISSTNLDDNISIARLWNEATLFCIRNDFARPTVHARNLFHTSAAMYDAWAAYNNTHRYLVGNELNGFTSELNTSVLQNATENIEETISYAAYRLLMHRFQNSPHLAETTARVNALMNELGYSTAYTDTDYTDGNPAALGNFIAQTYIDYGLTDGSREESLYDNAYYLPVNAPIAPVVSGNPTITDPNRWQSLSLDTYIDQSGNVIEGSSIDFLSPEWGNVLPFAMTDDDTVVYNRDGNNYIVYNDPGTPPMLDTTNTESSEAYKWGFEIVSIWSSHLDPYDGVIWDISPASIGNLNSENFPTGHQEFTQFYDVENGGVHSQGRPTNPITGQPYEPQMVPRGDYTRVLAEFWADGPESETPPGHWFVILNTVNDSPHLVRKFMGQGDELSALEWDIKAYFTLGGTMHDAAISAWSVKGWYDYVRPISAIRYMGDKGQSSDPNLPNYHPDGLPLVDGFVELIEEGDELSGQNNENIGQIKLLAWKGHSFISNTETDQAGVDWILSKQWWPYQRPSFVTPPFAGYVSGHSTYSRAAAEALTAFTGSEYFPGGMGEFFAGKNEFLVFEEGPSTDVILQWATYRDASDQCSLSRIWGGIHPPIDDVPGRKIGEKVGKEAYEKAITYFAKVVEEPEEPTEPTEPELPENVVLYPNPVLQNGTVTVLNTTENMVFKLYDMHGKAIAVEQQFMADETQISFKNLRPGVYVLKTESKDWKIIVQ